MIKELIFPRVCVICLVNQRNENGICNECEPDMESIPIPLCLGCGCNIDGVIELCQECLRNPRPWRRGYSVYPFTDIPRQLVLRFKYGGDIVLANIFAKSLATKLQFPGRFIEYDFIMPVPLHWFKKLCRGYNQSELIAHELSKLIQVPFVNGLVRKKWTKSQASLTRNLRRKNLKNAFSISKNMDCVDSTVLLVDDVLTTGTTLAACTEILIDAGCGSVDVVTIARG